MPLYNGMPFPLGIRRPSLLPPGADNSYEYPPDPYRRSIKPATNTNSNPPADQRATVTQEGPPHLPDELWVKIWKLHASDWVNIGHFYIVDNGPWLVNIWRGCLKCQLPVGLGVSHFARDAILSVIRLRGIDSWDDPPEKFKQWAHTCDKIGGYAAGDGHMAEDFIAEALIDFRGWAASCNMRKAPRPWRPVSFTAAMAAAPPSGTPHYRQ